MALPYSGKYLQHEESVFTCRLLCAHLIVESVFDVVIKCVPIFFNADSCSADVPDKTVEAPCCLYNFFKCDFPLMYDATGKGSRDMRRFA